ncbi:hypothetical protein BH09PAT4_BH09PAT4_08600 [soil metagenome]
MPSVSAADVFNGVDCRGKAADSAVCQDKSASGNPLTGSNGAIMKIANIVAAIAGVAAVITIVLAGLKFITSNGEANEIAGARKAVITAIIGLVVIAVARLIIGLVVGNL